MNRKKKKGMALAFMAVLLLVLIAIDLRSGYSSISFSDMAELLQGKASRALSYTFFELRMPRIVITILIGAGLALSGMLLQAITHNDMADPGLLGINAGSGVALAIFFVFFKQSAKHFSVWLPILSFAGAFLTFFVEYRLASVRKKMHPKRLLLIGVAVSLALSSLTTMLMLRMPDQDHAFVQSWLAGSIWGATWDNVLLLALTFVPLGLLVYYFAFTLDLFDLGHTNAVSLGVDVKKMSALLLGTAVAFSSLCYAVGGGLSFVGLICPHLARRLIGARHRVLVPASALTGAVLMCGADILSRTLLLPNEIPVGIVAAVLGAPYFLYLLVKE